jgi:hypothetical protein
VPALSLAWRTPTFDSFGSADLPHDGKSADSNQKMMSVNLSAVNASGVGQNLLRLDPANLIDTN